MKTINGYQYSKKEFPEYKTRVKVEIMDKNNVGHSLDIYTTKSFGGGNRDVFKADIIKDLMSTVTDKVDFINIVNISTKEQDDAATEMLMKVFELDKN